MFFHKVSEFSPFFFFLVSQQQLQPEETKATECFVAQYLLMTQMFRATNVLEFCPQHDFSFF